MRKGGQNECICADPVFLPWTSHILEEMYEGGYSAVVDMSKYFYNIPTHPDDHPFLGLIHPITGILYTYFGLPMGSSNSPSAASCVGNSFMRKLREKFEIFSGIGKAVGMALSLPTGMDWQSSFVVLLTIFYCMHQP